MFVKIVVVLLLVIVLASLLRGGQPHPGARSAPRLRLPVRTLMLRVAIALLVLGALLSGLHFMAGNATAVAFRSATVKDADYGRLAALDRLTDHTGRRVATADFRGKVVVVFFGYAHCPDICPTTLAGMRDALELLGPQQADRVQVLFVTVDPARDTPETLAAYVPWFDPRFRGLFGDAESTREAAREFRVFYSKVEDKSAMGYSIDHSATSYAYDPAGQLRLLIPHGATPEHIAADLSALLAGK